MIEVPPVETPLRHVILMTSSEVVVISFCRFMGASGTVIIVPPEPAYEYDESPYLLLPMIFT